MMRMVQALTFLVASSYVALYFAAHGQAQALWGPYLIIVSVLTITSFILERRQHRGHHD